MERTGHRSIEGVRVYKRTTDEQKRHVSDLLQERGPSTRYESEAKKTLN
ncbi:hypothetical protein SNE40_013219 [Patella caerulea]|uniref:Uncharacterized protein n=1 Tax=Patella caerulea TaxID=87958 RepID=A0AAN8JJ58_PATCE